MSSPGTLPPWRSCGLPKERKPRCSTQVRAHALVVGLLMASSIGIGAQSDASPLSEALATLTHLGSEAQGIPFADVIEATTGHCILALDTNQPTHAELRSKLVRAAQQAAETARAEGIFTARPNEAGNHMERFVRDALAEAGLPVRTPINTEGQARSTGYPDLEIPGTPHCYLELKTFSEATANTTQRSFYYSPSTTPKVTTNAVHLLLGYQMERLARDGRAAYLPVQWKLITLENLNVDLKFEFNQSNRGLYGAGAGDSLLGSGQVRQ